MDINEMVDKEKAELRESLQLDAQRYRKLKAQLLKNGAYGVWYNTDTFDATVDALPDPKENSNGGR